VLLKLYRSGIFVRVGSVFKGTRLVGWGYVRRLCD